MSSAIAPVGTSQGLGCVAASNCVRRPRCPQFFVSEMPRAEDGRLERVCDDDFEFDLNDWIPSSNWRNATLFCELSRTARTPKSSEIPKPTKSRSPSLTMARTRSDRRLRRASQKGSHLSLPIPGPETGYCLGGWWQTPRNPDGVAD